MSVDSNPTVPATEEKSELKPARKEYTKKEGTRRKEQRDGKRIKKETVGTDEKVKEKKEGEKKEGEKKEKEVKVLPPAPKSNPWKKIPVEEQAPPKEAEPKVSLKSCPRDN